MDPDTPLATPRRPLGRRLAWAAAALVGACLVLAAAGWSFLHSEAGLRWGLSQAPGLTADGVRGSVGSGRIEIAQLRWSGAPGTLQVDALTLDGLQWRWRPAPGQWLGLQATQGAAAQVSWTSAARDPTTPATPLAAPDSLAWPLALQLPLRIAQLQVDAAPALRDLSLQLALGADGGTLHRITALQLATAGLVLKDGQLQVQTRAPMTVQAQLALTGDAAAALPWAAQVQASGPLQRLAVTAQLQGGRPGDEPMAVSLDATATPFARWPLAALQLTTQALDLAALGPRLPQTSLSGQAHLAGGDGTPLQVDLQLDNRQPGRWDQGRLPLRHIEARIEGELAQPGIVDITALTLQAADDQGDAGRWQARGRWDGHTLSLDNTLAGLRPQRLDARAMALQLEGQMALTVRGLPSPDPAAPTAVDPPSVTLDARLNGTIDGTDEPLRLQTRAELSAEQIVIERFELASGAALARGTAQAVLTRQRWTLRSEGSVVEFDPRPWLPGAADAAWRQGPTRFNAQWSADLSLAAAALGQPPPTWLPALAGQARLQVPPSLVAGLPLQGDLKISSVPGARIDGRIELAGNTLSFDGRTDLPSVGDGNAGQWQLALDAPALHALAPLAAMFPAARAWAPQAGTVRADATLQGRWPALQSEGRLAVDGLRMGELQVGMAQATWRAEGGLTAPLAADLSVAQARWAGQTLQALQAQLSGTLAQHRLTVQAAVPLLPPVAIARSLDLTLQRGTRVAVQIDGAWAQDPRAAPLPKPAASKRPAKGQPLAPPVPEPGSRWTGQARDIELASWNGESLPAAASHAPWAFIPALAAELSFDAGGALQAALVEPGRLALAGGIGLRWEALRYEAAGQRIKIQATVDNFRLAPLLARWQPELGWAGDLDVALSLDLQAGERFDADLLIERRSGDLSVQDGADTRLNLGLSDLRLALNAHDGTWYFTQALAGTRLGEMGGAARVRTAPSQRWPAAGDPLDGALQARVADLGIWGTWVPPGWRLQGQLATQALLGGTFGAPGLTGTLTGRGLGARNLLLGVNVRDGEVAVRLDGERATVENFVLRAGDGELRLTGGATLGAEPALQLALTADRLQVLGRIDRRLVVSGQARLDLDRKRLALDGDLRVDSGLFDASRGDAPSLDDDVVVRRPGDAPRTGPTAGQPAPQRRIDVRVAVDLGDRLRVRGRGLDTRLAGELRVTAPAGRLAIDGSVNTVGGTYAAYGQKMVIERGRVAFSGAPDNPRLDVLALRPGLDLEVGVEIIGSISAPRIRLYSNPDMSDTDKLSWLVLGRAPGAAGRADTALLQRAAVALLSGEGESTTDQVIRKLGLDELSVRQSDDAAQETVVSLGKQISDRWYVGYERSVNATQGTWQVIYRAARRFTLRAESGEDQSLDAIWVWQIP